jgi:hypothetical protein
MPNLELIAILVQFLIPIALISWVTLRRHRMRLSWALDLWVATAYVVAIAVAAPWLALPWYLPAIFGALLVGSAALGASRISPEPWAASGQILARVGVGARMLAAIVCSAVTLFALSGRQRFSEPPVDLVFPLKQGTYQIANGGSRQIVNPHLRTRTGERYRPFRGQSYAVDIVRIGSWGSRRARFSPDDPHGFAIFGDSIHAPCSGKVVQSADGFSDRLAPGADPQTLEGNHVLLECGAVWILLAHMKQGTVQVANGERVAEGDLLGLVGNSGRSDEPHLHIHAQTPGTREAPLGGQPVPVTFAGRHLVRNDRVRTNAESGPLSRGRD